MPTTEFELQIRFVADSVLKQQGWEWPSVQLQQELPRAITKSVLLRLAEEAGQELGPTLMRELDPNEALKLIDELTSAKCSNCARLTALLEDRQSIADEIFMADCGWSSPPHWEHFNPLKREHYLKLADRLIAYLKPLG